MDELQYLAHGFAAVTTWQNTGLMLTGILLGIVVGVLPGLGGPNGVPSCCR
jgi:TctA family transporter